MNDGPSERDVARALRLLAPYLRVCRPHVTGVERVPERGPMLLVGNHTLFGVLDVPVLFATLWEHRRVWPRSLGDHAHFAIPAWRELVGRVGGVDGTRENCAALMKAGATILVFPGGAREVSKKKGEENTLVWGNRVGFARMAIEHRCPIVPFSSLGVDDAFRIVADKDDLFASPLGSLVRRAGVREDLLAPLVVPQAAQRLYLRFAEPVDPTSFGADPSDDDAAWALREKVAAAIEAGLDELRDIREDDPDRDLSRRIVRRLVYRGKGQRRTA